MSDAPRGRLGPLPRLRRQAAAIFDHALDAVEPRRSVSRALEGTGVFAAEGGPVDVLAFGKAAPAMTAGAIDELEERVGGVLVVSPESGRAQLPCESERLGIRWLPSDHPVPSERGERAACSVETFCSSSRDDLLVLVSGGGSALLPAPAEGVSLTEKSATASLLMEAGASIDELNVVRKHLSRLKGGQMTRHLRPRLQAHSKVLVLVLSDVVGDDLSVVASGPLVGDPSTFADALDVLERRACLERVPVRVRQRLEAGARGDILDTPSPGSEELAGVEHLIVGGNEIARTAAAVKVRGDWPKVVDVDVPLSGEARAAAGALVLQVAERLGAITRSGTQTGPVARREPLALVAGGETTVTVRGSGRGGRNLELSLAFALEAERLDLGRPWVLLSAGTDGVDGPTPAAGGLVDSETLERVRRAGLDPTAALDDNDSYSVLDRVGDTLVTGPTGTNVADLVICLVGLDEEHAAR